MINWDEPDKRHYQHGLDHGVLYIPDMNPVPWNGLISLDEGGEGTTELMYRDGIVYVSDAEPSDFTAKLTAMMYPDEFGACVGFPKATDGLFVDNQKPRRFDLSYRSLVGSGTRGDMFGYQIHLVYKCMATIGQRQRRSIGPDSSSVEFTFDIACTPVKLEGYRPTAHYVIDTRNMTPSVISEIEGILYGVGNTPGRMPTPGELYDIMDYGDAIVVRVHPDGTYTVTASDDNLMLLSPTSFVMKNINGTDNGDGTYVISDGGNTDVIIETP